MSKIGQNKRKELGLLPSQKTLGEGKFEAIGIQKVEGGYRLVKLVVEDGNIVSTTVTNPEVKPLVVEKYKLETTKVLLKEVL